MLDQYTNLFTLSVKCSLGQHTKLFKMAVDQHINLFKMAVDQLINSPDIILCG